MRRDRVQWAITLVVACAVVMAVPVCDVVAVSQASRMVQDANKQVTITIPAAWQVQSPSGNITLKATAPTTSHALPDSVDVVVHGLLPGVNNAQSCIQEAEWVTQHFGHVNFTALGSGPVTVGGLPAYSHTYVWKASTGESRWSFQVCIVQQATGFVLTGTTGNTSGLPTRVAVLRQVINSIWISAKLPAPPTKVTNPGEADPVDQVV